MLIYDRMSDTHAAGMGPLPEGARAEAAILLARAFHTDPFFIHLFPNESLRPAMLRAVMQAFLRVLSLRGSTYCVSGAGLQGVIGIQRPGEHAGIVQMAQAYAPALARIARLIPAVQEPLDQLRRIAKGLSVLGEMEKHHPREPHFYVLVLGVDPPAQRGGIGRRLLGEVLAEADSERRIAHLETSRPENIGYYQKFGFDVVAELRGGPSAPVWVMTRPAVR
jgi:ribosomal protein S18 acetylase RimI-like enzyme